tara:strand:- start:21 stop:188 length:168 start_codon:yes stop_codon:yes gene_type:complete
MDTLTILLSTTGILMFILFLLVIALAVKVPRPRKVTRRIKDDLNSIKSHINGDDD